MNRIFYHCSSLISLNINSFNTSNVVQPQFCYDGVENDDTYKYEYKNISNDTCPSDTHPTIDNLHYVKKNQNIII